MAESDASIKSGKGAMDFLKQKVGPLPLGVWLLFGIAIVVYIREKQSGGSLLGSLTGSSSSGSATPNQQTDPAGNIGTIDPATGYVYGTPEDLAALAANNAGTTGTSSGSGTTSTVPPATSTYADNNAWGSAAINYLVGLGIDPASANEAIQQYLSSQTLTTQQQADVNEAIQALGAPPSLPGPTGTAPSPIVTQPGTTTTGTTGTGTTGTGTTGTGTTGTGTTGTGTAGVSATNPVTGLTISSKQPTTISLKWNAAANATGYTIRYGKSAGANTWSTTTPAGQPSVTIGNLDSGTMYYFQVQATPAGSGAGSASTSGATTKAAAAASTTSAAKATTYTVKSGDTLSGIAAKLNYPGGWEALYAKNKAVIGSNPNLIKPGQVLQV
jgi:LysM repeat protein